MAIESVVVSEGTGKNIAVDTVDTDKQVQYVKLMDGTDGSATVVAIGGGVEAGALRVTVASDSTGVLSVDDNGGALTVDGTVTANLSATDNAVLDALVVDTGEIQVAVEAINTKLATGTVIGDVNLGATDNAVLDDIAANQTDASQKTQVVDSLGNVIGATSNALDVNIKSGNPTTITATQGTASNLKVEAAIAAGQSIGAVCTNAGTFAVQADLGANNDVTAVGTVADDATTPGAPVMIGGKAVETDGTDPSSVSAEDDVAILRTDRQRRLLVNDANPYLWTALFNQGSATADHLLKAAPGANLSLYITDILVSNGATAGTVLFEEDSASAKTTKIPTLYLAANGGAVLNLKTPIRCTANKDFGYTSATVTTHSVLVNGYVAP